MTEYKLEEGKVRKVVRIDCRIYPPMDCDDSFDGPTGPELFNILTQIEAPGYDTVVDDGEVFYVSSSGTKYKPVVRDRHGNLIGTFSGKDTETFEELFLADERGSLIGIGRESEVKPLIDALNQRFEELHEINLAELERGYSDDDISPDDVD